MLAQKRQMEYVTTAGQHLEHQRDARTGELIEGRGGQLPAGAEGPVGVGDVLVLLRAAPFRFGLGLVLAEEGLEGRVGQGGDVDAGVLVVVVGAALAEADLLLCGQWPTSFRLAGFARRIGGGGLEGRRRRSGLNEFAQPPAHGVNVARDIQVAVSEGGLEPVDEQAVDVADRQGAGTCIASGVVHGCRRLLRNK